MMRYSHCGILVGDDLVVEASWNGLVVNRWKSNYKNNPKQKYEVYELKLEFQEDFDGVVWKNTLELIGQPYGYKQLWGFFEVWFKRTILRKDVPNPVRDGKGSVVCSEWLFYNLRGLNLMNSSFQKWFVVSKLHGFEPDSIKPDDIWKQFEKEEIATLVESKGY